MHISESHRDDGNISEWTLEFLSGPIAASVAQLVENTETCEL